MSAKKNPWERREGEGTKAFEAFKIYLSLGEERSADKVGKQLGKSNKLMERWSARHDWVKRAHAYDDWLSDNEFRQNKKEREKMREKQIKIAMRFQDVAMDRLAKMSDKDIAKMKDRDVLEWFLKAADLEDKLREASLKEHPKAAEDNTGQASLADVIVSAYKKRMEEGLTDADE